jgi:hypothetical protein
VSNINECLLDVEMISISRKKERKRKEGGRKEGRRKEGRKERRKE